jgi:F0F1-type ATP synthase membrane subunit b/b'
MEHQFDFMQAIGIPYFNFALFLVAFIVFFRKPLANMAKTRRDNFLAASKEASQALEKAKESFDEVKKRFDALEAELSSFKVQSEKSAQEEGRRSIEDAERVAKQIKEETNRLAGEALERAKHELRQEVVQAAKLIVEKRIASDLDQATREKIISAKIAQTQTMNANA